MALTKVQHRMIEDDVFDIRDFGAVGDGTTEDTAAIQAAINAAYSAGGGVVIVPPSANEYIFTAVQLKDYVTIKGTGGKLKLKDNYCVDAGTDYLAFYSVDNATNITVDGLIIDGNQANNLLRNNLDLVELNGSNHKIVNCFIESTTDTGIFLANTTNSICSDNHVIGYGGSGGELNDIGIYISTGEGTGDTERRCVCTNNIVQGFNQGGIAIKRSSQHVLCSNNIIENCGNGITVEEFGTGTGGEPDNLLISNNVINNIGHDFQSISTIPLQAGIIVQLSTNVVCSGNLITNVSGSGIGLSGATKSSITGNNIKGYTASPRSGGNGNAGISVSDRDGQTPTEIVITSNQIGETNDYGIVIDNGINIGISNNYFESDGVAADFGNNCDQILFNNNRMDGASSDLTYDETQSLRIIFQSNYLVNGANQWAKAGNRTFAIATPVGATTPRAVGEILETTSGGDKYWFATGSTSSDWVQFG